MGEPNRIKQTDLSLVSVDSTVARSYHDAAGMRGDEEVISALEEAVEESKEAAEGNESHGSKANRTPSTPTGRNDGAFGDDVGPV